MSHFVRLCMDYEDSNWFKPDGIWLLRRFADSGDLFPDENGAILLEKAHPVGGLMCISLLDQRTCVTTRI